MEVNFPEIEKKILKFWEENKIFEKSIKQRARAGDFVFYEGPPTANGKPGIHHVLARTYKDIVCRYKTMQGFRVLRKAGWDTHGLPVELEIEKKLGLKNKKDIEKYGIAQFNKKCKESVWQYKDEWEKLTERIGFWLDMENSYITYENNYIESLWWIIKQIYQKGLLYQDYKVIPYCPRCGTSLSSHEVAQGYKKIEEPSIYVKFRIKGSNKSLLVWTTTPWTLPGNVAVAVNPRFTYVKVKIGEEYLILAKERMKSAGVEGEIVEEFKGEELLNLEYEPLFSTTGTLPVIAGDFVSLEEGTGLVHIAPAFGEDDMAVGKENNLPVILNVDKEGKFKKEVENWAGMFVKDADPLIIENIKKRGLLFKEELYEHDYPFCWRCDSPLLYYAKESWFINMQKVKKDLLNSNQKINWVPLHLKQGRFGEWLEELKDWAFSRERYWGTPLPIWQCQKCGHQEIIGSKKDLLFQKFSDNQYYILRHGQTIHQTKKKAMTYPWPEKKPVLLTKEGRAQIKKAAKKLRKKNIDLIYSSDMSRACQTAEIVAQELKTKIVFDKRLRDVNLGSYQGGPKEKFHRDFPNPWEKFYDKKPPGGENWGDVRKRVTECLADINGKHQNKTILIISHGDPLWLLQGWVRGKEDEDLIKEKVKKADINTGEIRQIQYKELPLAEDGRLDFHRPYIDEIKFQCPKCPNKMKRVLEIADVWFDSGAMPFASHALFPADYICEAIDQTRGWFYTLLAIATLLGFGTPYKNVISLGHVLDEKGEKMSKSKGNVIDPWYIVGKYGADATRWYFYTVNQPGDVKLFTEKDIGQTLKKFIMTYWNSYQFFKTYVGVGHRVGHRLSKNILDKWIISRLNNLIQQATEKLDKYDVTGAGRAIESFVIDDLSLWYIRRSRRRFQKPERPKELKESSATLSHVLLTLNKLTAPFVPFLSEAIYYENTSRSVHLEEWPEADKKLVNEKLNQKMEEIRKATSLALAERAKTGIKVRQPLGKLQITNYQLQKDKELLELIKEEVNVKKIIFGKSLELETKITQELREEGVVREVIRQIQEMRKKAGLKPQDKIFIGYSVVPELNEILIKNKTFILKETKAQDFRSAQKRGKVFDAELEAKVDNQTLWLAIKKA